MHQALAEPGGDQQAAHHRHQPQSAAERVGAQHALEVGRQHEEPAEQGDRDQRDGHRGPAEHRFGEQPQVEHRVLLAAAAQHQAGQCGHRADQRAEHQGVAPAALGALDDPPGQRGQTAGRQSRGGQVDPGRGRVGGLGEQQQAGDRAEQHQRHVDQEDRAPPEAAQQQPADDRPERHAERRHGGQQGGGAALFAGREDRRDHRHRHRHHEGGSQAHPGAGGDQGARAVGQGAEHRGHAEQGEAEHQGAAAPDPVAEQAGREQGGGEHHRVGVDDPLLLTGGGVQLPGQVGQRDVQHRGVEADDEHAERDRDQRDPAPRVRSRHDGTPIRECLSEMRVALKRW